MKLTNFVREDIRDKALRHKFEPVIVTLIARTGLVAEKAYDRLYPAAILRKMVALPKGWLPTELSIDVSFGGGDYERLPFNGQYASHVLARDKRRASVPSFVSS